MRRLIVALDTVDLARARSWASAVAPHAGMVKLGLEFFLAHGQAGYQQFRDQPIFLDLKLHDIPNTVAGAIRAILPLQPRLVTVHASGGAAMVQAARRAADQAGEGRPLILGVTVLTSLDRMALHHLGVDAAPAEQALRLGRLAVEAGADGLVCSPHEVSMLRRALGPDVKLVVPGIRPSGSPADDQARVMTPREAVEAGADWIVVGRPVTASANPGEAAASIAASIQ